MTKAPTHEEVIANGLGDVVRSDGFQTVVQVVLATRKGSNTVREYTLSKDALSRWSEAREANLSNFD